MTHQIFRSAHERILEIWEYTDREWGEEQADRYITGLFAELDKISEARHRWKPIQVDGFEGIFFARYRHHYLFFRQLGSGALGVISVLHESMDLPSRILEDAKQNEAMDCGDDPEES